MAEDICVHKSCGKAYDHTATNFPFTIDYQKTTSSEATTFDFQVRICILTALTPFGLSIKRLSKNMSSRKVCSERQPLLLSQQIYLQRAGAAVAEGDLNSEEEGCASPWGAQETPPCVAAL